MAEEVKTPTDGTVGAQAESKTMNRFPMEGVEVWKNPKNRFIIFQLHYSADPRKRDPEYRAGIKSGMPIRQYLQEYELQWDSFEGFPVYSDFNKAIHGARTVMHPRPGLPLLRGWDFGLTPACVVGQYVNGQLLIFKEFTAINASADKFVPETLRALKLLYPHWADQKKNYLDFIDPAGFSKSQTDMNTCAQVMRDNDMEPRPGPVVWEVRRKSVENFLIRMNKGEPSFQIDLAGCPVLVRGFEGGYRYPEKAFDIEPNKVRPLKDEHSHPHDALQYLCYGVSTLKQSRHSSVPEPSYSLTREKSSA